MTRHAAVVHRSLTRVDSHLAHAPARLAPAHGVFRAGVSLAERHPHEELPTPALRARRLQQERARRIQVQRLAAGGRRGESRRACARTSGSADAVQAERFVVDLLLDARQLSYEPLALDLVDRGGQQECV